MGILTHAMVQQVTWLATKRSAYGDIVPDPTAANRKLFCRFRVIGETIRVNNREELRSDNAMVWFEPSTDIAVNDIILYEGRYWEIMRINEARAMDGTTIQFLKCYVAAHDMVS